MSDTLQLVVEVTYAQLHRNETTRPLTFSVLPFGCALLLG